MASQVVLMLVLDISKKPVDKRNSYLGNDKNNKLPTSTTKQSFVACVRGNKYAIKSWEKPGWKKRRKITIIRQISFEYVSNY